MDRYTRDGTSTRFASSRLRLRRWLLALGLGTSVLLAACSMPLPQQSSSGSVAVESAPAPAPASRPSIVEGHAAPQISRLPFPQAPQAHSTLGTQWGEGRTSRVVTIDATRLTPGKPQAQSALRYTDEDSIRRSLGADADRQLSVLLAGGKIEWSVVDGRGAVLPIYSQRGGSNYHVAGRSGERYELVYVNRSQRVYELVATVDGLDVLSGQPGSIDAEGYLIRPGETMRVEGFRKNSNEVAAFRFSAKDNAYASNTPAGNPRNIGVIGSALFEVQLAEASRVSPPPSPVRGGGPDAFPADKGRFAAPPQYR
ncbi:hypothetical protein [Diaphorobacter sp. HDW4B]|uniref:hypothetical protein n=1 Tax=Diaphorobacter sp. HDW4B TaxID=2714925 RepID=UPI001F0E2C00|nr:hypothetical protein [Diaphorobacter sp. HDW4B]